MPDETHPTAGQPDESAPTAEQPTTTPTVEHPDPPGPAAEAPGGAVRMRHMVDSGKVEMTLGQLLAMFHREDIPQDREEVADELFAEGLVARPLLTDAKYGEKVRVTKAENATPDHMLRNGIFWAVLIPIVGVILAIRLFARERVGQGFAVLGTAIVVTLLIFYGFGAFDRPLSSIGLNVNECARNGFGQTFCGKELDEYRQRVEAAKLKITQAKESIEADQRKSSEQAREREAEVRKQAGEREAEVQANEHRRRNERAEELTAKLRQERAIEEREPEGSAAYDLAHAEYEATRAEAQQLIVEAKSAEGK